MPAADAPDSEDSGTPDAAAIMAGTRALQRAAGATPEGDELEDGGTIDGPAEAPLQGAGAFDFLDPRRALRVASVYLMKDRAGTVGWNGVSTLIGELLDTSRAPLHLVGHSYGAKVVLSALAAAQLPRLVSSALLLEPAVSHLCFADQVPTRTGKGGYHDVLGKIRGSILMTYSAHDFPLHEVFHHALQRPDDVAELKVAGAGTAAGAPPSVYAALGGYGPRGAHELLVEPLPEPGAAIELPAAVVPVAFDGTLSQRIAGHGDVATPYTAWLLYAQMVSQGGADGQGVAH
jgi:pimeloyl-ACP methyl ester carboxylesterase